MSSFCPVLQSKLEWNCVQSSTDISSDMDKKEMSLDGGGPLADPSSGEGTELRKPHEMIVLVPKSKRVTLTGRRLYNALLQVAQSRLIAMEAMPPADFLFEAPLPALLRTTGSSGEDRTAAKRYLREMRGLEVDWETTAPGDGMKWRDFSMLSEVAIEVRRGENWVSWSYPPTIMAALREPARWASIDLAILARLGTYAAVALYEICARYRHNPSGLTSRKPVQWWADALSQAPRGAERREWRKFKSERVKDAIEEINRETDLEVELIEHKQGRAVTEAQFAVRFKRQALRHKPQDDGPVDANLVLRGESLGIREVRLEGLISEFGEARVREKIDALERRAANSKLRSIDNAYSYLRSLLRNDDVPVELESPPEVGPVVAPAPRVQIGGLAMPQPQPASSDTTWLNARIASIKAEIMAMEAPRRQQWVDLAVAELAARKLLSAVVARRIAQGDVLHGVLGSVMVRLYALDRHGDQWDQPAALAPA
ncbi:replication initiator protein [Sphaerotilus hippei]|uniref:Replication initiator protein n=2 Tax=Sphaerotilus hippei TaxID=744406 RepID=A0A318HAK0_9BURK|nr:replication initiator protein [Sphaerotilus hippei]